MGQITLTCLFFNTPERGFNDFLNESFSNLSSFPPTHADEAIQKFYFLNVEQHQTLMTSL